MSKSFRSGELLKIRVKIERNKQPEAEGPEVQPVKGRLKGCKIEGQKVGSIP
jgi:hypothetical protein